MKGEEERRGGEEERRRGGVWSAVILSAMLLMVSDNEWMSAAMTKQAFLVPKHPRVLVLDLKILQPKPLSQS